MTPRSAQTAAVMSSGVTSARAAPARCARRSNSVERRRSSSTRASGGGSPQAGGESPALAATSTPPVRRKTSRPASGGDCSAMTATSIRCRKNPLSTSWTSASLLANRRYSVAGPTAAALATSPRVAAGPRSAKTSSAALTSRRRLMAASRRTESLPAPAERADSGMNPALWRSAYVIALLSNTREVVMIVEEAKGSARVRLGHSDLTVRPVGLGCMGMSQFYGAADDSESVETIRSAIDLGVDFLDTSDAYGAVVIDTATNVRGFGHNEQLIGAAIHGRRHNVVLATKFGVKVP